MGLCGVEKRILVCFPNLESLKTEQLKKTLGPQGRGSGSEGKPLVNSNSAPKRHNPILNLFIPIIVFVGFIGWCLYWLGSNRREKKQ